MRFALTVSVTLTVLALGLGALVAACGNVDPAAAACDSIAAARCDRLAACSTADLMKRFADQAACEDRQRIACGDALAAADTGATAASVDACAAAIPAEACADYLGNQPAEACLPRAGARALGAACQDSAQCASTFCAIADGERCGACAAPPVAGTSCASAGCGPHLICVASTARCEAPVPGGASCAPDMPCARGTVCVGASAATGVSGTCVAELTSAGAPCDPTHATGADCSADAGLTCDTTHRQCVVQPIAASGETCGNVGGVATRCAAGATCIKATGAATGLCVAPAADGAACDLAAGPGCLFPARCVPVSDSAGGTAGTCELPADAACA